MTNSNGNIDPNIPVFNQKHRDIEGVVFDILVGDGIVRFSSPTREDIQRIILKHFFPVVSDIHREHSYLPWVNIQEG